MSDPEYRERVEDAFPELTDIAADDRRERVIDAWTLGLERGGWRSIEDVPYAWNIHEVSNDARLAFVARADHRDRRIREGLEHLDDSAPRIAEDVLGTESIEIRDEPTSGVHRFASPS